MCRVCPAVAGARRIEKIKKKRVCVHGCIFIIINDNSNMNIILNINIYITM